jgi:hypothetical protein
VVAPEPLFIAKSERMAGGMGSRRVGHSRAERQDWGIEEEKGLV